MYMSQPDEIGWPIMEAHYVEAITEDAITENHWFCVKMELFYNIQCFRYFHNYLVQSQEEPPLKKVKYI